MKVFNHPDAADAELKTARAQDAKDAFVQRVWNGRRHVWGIRVGIDKWYMGKGEKPQTSKQAEAPIKKK